VDGWWVKNKDLIEAKNVEKGQFWGHPYLYKKGKFLASDVGYLRGMVDIFRRKYLCQYISYKYFVL